MLRCRFRDYFTLGGCLLAAFASGCGGELIDEDGEDGSTSTNTCDPATLVFETGDATGHADPFGAKEAGQARAGAIQADQVLQPAAGRQQVQDGDFILINEKIAVFIEGSGTSDGYGRFPGEIIAVDRVGSDGKPLGLSKFIESLQLTSLFLVNPTSVSVMNDGANGEAAVVRVTGVLQALPFLAETFGAAFPKQYEGLTAAYDFSLEPGAEKLTVRFGIANPSEFDVDTGLNLEGSSALLGFFQGSFSKLFLPGRGYGKGEGSPDWVGFDNDSLPFAYLGPDGAPLDFGGIDISGFQVFTGPGIVEGPCSAMMFDDHQIVVGEPGGGVDLLGEVVRRENDVDPYREISGVVTSASGAPVAGAYVHARDAAGAYVSRATTNDSGGYVIHVPDGAATLVAQKRGYRMTEPEAVDDGASEADLVLPENGFVHVTATEDPTGVPIPVRIQIIPEEALDPTPEAYGDPDENDGRLWQEFSVSGDETLAVPPGQHRVIVSRGYEWEMLDTTVDVAAGATVEVLAPLLHSVDTTGAMSGDFHIHSMYSADSSDPVVYKVRGALADGLDIPVSSEHEWVISFQPIIEMLGASDWAFGLPSEELTTFTWGHFGVVPVTPKPGKLNNGAVDWLGSGPTARPASEVFADAQGLPEDPALIVNHPRSGALQGYFDKVQLDRETGSSTHELWSDNFDAIEICNESTFDSNRDGSVADWFALLEHGHTYWAVGSSDSHALRNAPVGYPRTYMFLGYDDPHLASANDVRDAIVGGHMTIGGGLFMTVEGPGSSAPGSFEPRTSDTVELTVTVRGPSWIAADTLEIIVNGESSEQPLLPVGAGPANEYVNVVSVTLPDVPRAWVVFNAKGPGDLEPLHPGRHPFAASNPIFFER